MFCIAIWQKGTSKIEVLKIISIVLYFVFLYSLVTFVIIIIIILMIGQSAYICTVCFYYMNIGKCNQISCFFCCLLYFVFMCKSCLKQTKKRVREIDTASFVKHW